MSAVWAFATDTGIAIVPYVRTTQRQKWVDKRYKRYEQWKSYIRLRASLVGLPAELDKKTRYEIEVLVKWEKAARADGDNVLKGVLDALFRNDRNVLKATIDAHEFTGTQGLAVVLREAGLRRVKQ